MDTRDRDSKQGALGCGLSGEGRWSGSLYKRGLIFSFSRMRVRPVSLSWPRRTGGLEFCPHVPSDNCHLLEVLRETAHENRREETTCRMSCSTVQEGDTGEEETLDLDHLTP